MTGTVAKRKREREREKDREREGRGERERGGEREKGREGGRETQGVLECIKESVVQAVCPRRGELKISHCERA